jgi:hypothetical protein
MHVGYGGRFSLSLLMFSVIAATKLAAQGTASAAADSLFRALAQHDWAGAARLVDPAHAASQRKLDLALVVETLAITARQATARAQSSGALVGIGNEIDTMEVERTLRRRADQAVILYGESTTFGRLVERSPQAHLAGYFEAVQSRFRVLAVERQALTEAVESDSVRHVVYRRARGESLRGSLVAGGQPLEVLTMVRRGAAWRARLNSDLLPVATWMLVDQGERDEVY